MKADLPDVVAFKIAANEEELRQLTAMMCTGLPESLALTARWRLEPPDALCVEVEVPGEGAYRQKFNRSADGIRVHQDLLVLHSKYHRQGHAKRLMRNLLLIYDNLGITDVRTFANHTNGGYTWAILGARPLDPDQQREAMIESLDFCIRNGQVEGRYRKAVLKIISETPDDTLMQRVAEMVGPDGVEVGRLVLVRLSWDAYWNLSDQTTRDYLQEALT